MNLLNPVFWQAFRFWSKVDFSGDCWTWKAALFKTGYGAFGIRRKVYYAHRISYEKLRGPIPVGLEIDHLCRVRRCVNPGHLEPVTHRVNVVRGDAPAVTAERMKSITHCPSGHEYNDDNTYLAPTQKGTKNRMCRTCMRSRNAEWKKKNADKVTAYNRAYLPAWRARKAAENG